MTTSLERETLRRMANPEKSPGDMIIKIIDERNALFGILVGILTDEELDFVQPGGISIRTMLAEFEK